MTALPPGSTIGILGGGQLGRMLVLAAARLGLNCHIYAPETESPAFAVSAARTCAPFADRAALSGFAAAVDVITYEFENVPVDTVQFLETKTPVRPGSAALAVAQDRLAEKQLARRLGARTAEFHAVSTRDDLATALQRIGMPAILKTNRLGYDGKGQAAIRTAAEAAPAFAAMSGAPAILESFVPFHMEVSVVAARNRQGAVVCFDVTENVHLHHILHRSSVPAGIGPELMDECRAITGQIAQALDYVGVLAVEYFVTGTGQAAQLWVNEIAPRVHNSGHWTLDACLVSQFEQHIRAVAGWPLGDGHRHSDAVMTNLIGSAAEDFAGLAGSPGTALHLYGKAESRAGRKMGHVTRISPRQPP